MMHEGRVAALLRPQVLPSAALRQGTVVSAQTTTVTITIGAGTTNISGVAYLRGYVPVAGDTVWLLQNGPDLLVLGSAYGGITEMLTSSVAANEGLTSLNYANLATTGPAVTMTGTVFLITVSCQAYNVTAGDGALMAYDISGATTSAATDIRAFGPAGFSGGSANMLGSRRTVTVCTPGVNTFTAKYRAVTGGTGGFVDRQLIVERVV